MSIAFAELAVTTNFSFLRSGSHPEEMVEQAKALGLAGIGVADRNTLAGVVRAHMAAKEQHLRLAVGARLVFRDGTPDVLAYPKHRAGYAQLCRLLTIGNGRALKGECFLDRADLLAHAQGLQCLVCADPAQEGLAELLRDLRAAAGEAWVAAPVLYDGLDARRVRALSAIAGESGARLVASTAPLIHRPERKELLDALTCVREKTTLAEAGRLLEANAERHLKTPEEIARLYRAYPEAVAESVRFLDGVTFSMDELRYEYPEETKAGYATPQEALEAFSWEGAQKRYPNGVPEKVRKALRYELDIVAQLKYAPYFLTVHDIVRFARSGKDIDGNPTPEILCQGRGSAANSTICYCLGVTEADPSTNELLFERFLSAERNEPPDIDVDFEHERREEAIQYVYKTYGRHRAGLAATLICYRGRSAIREMAKVFGYSEDAVASLAQLFHWWTQGITEKDIAEKGFDITDPRLLACIRLADELRGFPRHLSQHVGGFVITRERLDDVVPIQNARMDDRTVVEWNKDDLEALGILKVDLLGLGMLTCIRKAFDLVHQHYGCAEPSPLAGEGRVGGRSVCATEPLRDAFLLADVAAGERPPPPAPSPQGGGGRLSISALMPATEDRVYEMLKRADSLGVFQVESRAQMSMLPRLRPEKFYDLVIEVAIVRPGPIQGGMVHPYLKRKQELEKVTYPSKELEKVLERTLGVPLFQEQAMQIAIVAAGFSPPEADKLRRAMATFRRVGTIGLLKDKFINGMIANGYDRDFAERSFSQIEGFGEYGFPESHAASFAILVYVSSWLKCHYPDVFAAALLNAQPMGFYAPAQIIRDAADHGVEVRAIDVNHSDWDCTLEPGRIAAEHIASRHSDMRGDIRTQCALRLGFRQAKGLREEDLRKLVTARGAGYDSVRDLWLRTGLSPAVIEQLANADAFRSLGLDRREALWAARGLMRVGGQDDLPLFARGADPTREPDYHLPRMPLGEHVVEDYRHLTLSLKAHPLKFMRRALETRGIIQADKLEHVRDGTRVRIAGLVTVRQRPGTAKGVIFMTLEDESYFANVIVWPKVFERYRAQVVGARLCLVEGRVQSQSGVIHVVAERVIDETAALRLLGRDGEDLELPAKIDEARRGSIGDSRDTFAKKAREAMPGGRNFH